MVCCCGLPIRVFACVYVRLSVSVWVTMRVCVCVYVYAYAYVFVYVYVCVSVCVCVCTRVSMCVSRIAFGNFQQQTILWHQVYA